MAFTAPPKSVSVAALGFYELCEFAKLSRDEQDRMLGHKEAAQELAMNRQLLRSEQTALLEAERQLTERKAAIDADWAALRQVKIEHDAAVVAHQERVKAAADEAERNLSAAMARSAGLDEREAKAAEALKANQSELTARAEHLSDSMAELRKQREALDAREAAIAAREQAAAELSAMLAKVRG